MQNNILQEWIEKYEICDAHAHIFPEKISQKAVSSIGAFYHLPMISADGVADALIESGKKIKTSRYLVCSTATTPHQVESINAFIADECRKHPEFVGFGTLHPDYDSISSQIDFCIKNGIRGIKLHPDFQKFNIDDKKAFSIYEAAAGKLPILFHTGDDRYDYSSPLRLKKVVQSFKKLVAIAAHFGGYARWEDAVSHLAGEENVFFDTSSSLAFLTPDKAREYIKKYGVSHLFFGTDFPMWSHKEELERFMRLGLSEEENSAILGKNFKAFFEL